jgi:putative transcriptional regulator
MRKTLPPAALTLGLLGAWLLAAPALADAGDPAKGKLLVARRGMADPNFAETVILLLDYDEEGAMGLVINLPTELGVAAALPNLDSMKQAGQSVYIGGPVALGQMLLLVRTRQMPEDSLHIFDDVYLSSSPALLDRLGRDGDEAPPFRVFAGHAGWSPGQLDGEVARGVWHVLPAESDWVFNEAPGELWRELIEKSSAQWARYGGRVGRKVDGSPIRPARTRR